MIRSPPIFAFLVQAPLPLRGSGAWSSLVTKCQKTILLRCSLLSVLCGMSGRFSARLAGLSQAGQNSTDALDSLSRRLDELGVSDECVFLRRLAVRFPHRVTEPMLFLDLSTVILDLT
jgi:hypothetical protein